MDSILNNEIIRIALLVIALITVFAYILYRSETKKSPMQCFLEFINYKGLLVLLSLVTLYFVSYLYDDSKELVDITILSTIIIAFLVNSLSSLITDYIKNKCEDELKLTTDYDSLVKKYAGSKSEFCEGFTIDKNSKDKTSKYIPVIVDYTWKNFNKILIVDKKEMYDLQKSPQTKTIEKYQEEIFLSHDTSNIYNQLCIRVEDWCVIKDHLVIETSRTTYHSSLITNRALDYNLKYGFTPREILQPGPFVPPLSESVLSNHIGFNAFIISKDGYILFIKRNNIVSIGKGSLGTSVSASVKIKYALDPNTGKVNFKWLRNSISLEIEDEIKITKNKQRTSDKKTSPLFVPKIDIEIIAAYRDILEGNKPQLLAFINVDCNHDAITDNFKKVIKAKHKENKRILLTKEDKEQEDGNTLIWVTKDDFLSFIVPGPSYTLKLRKPIRRSFQYLPSVGASIILTQQYIRECDNNDVKSNNE